MSPLLRGLADLLSSVVAPPACAACDGAVPRGTAFCVTCAGTLVRATNPDPDRIAAFEYGGAVALSLKRFKFDDRPDLTRALVAGLARELPGLSGVEVVVPVPLHPSRLVERGYNQAALLARPIAKLLGSPWAPHALARVVTTERQTDLRREERVANVRGAFRGVEVARLAGRAVLLVDDVETTGATLAGCRAALEAVGVRSTRTLVVARAV